MKKLIYFIFILVMFGGMIVIQSCGESPIDSAGEIDKKPNIGPTTPNKYYATGIGFPKNCTTGERLPLYAAVGNNSGTLVGYAEFTSITGSQAPYSLTIKLDFTNPDGYPWVAEDIHCHISNTASGIPRNKGGNPAIGSFYYKNSPEYSGNTFTFVYDNVPEPSDSGYFVALHLAVCTYGGTTGFENYLPNQPVQFNLQRNYQYGYFQMQFSGENAGFLATYYPPGPTPPGMYYGYCIDKDHLAQVGTQCGFIYSSNDTLPSNLLGSGLIDYPENLPHLINYIINKYTPGSNVIPCNNAGSQVWPFTTGAGGIEPNGSPQEQVVIADIQNAIWSLIDDLPPNNSWMNPRNPSRVWGIIYDAIMNGSNYTPDCGDKIAAVLIPTANCEGEPVWNGKQPMIFWTLMPCETQCETAWADGRGFRFPGANQWGTYFRWNLTCPTP